MPDLDQIDGDVYVTPRYLAGSTHTGDPALEPLLALGWDLRYDDLAIMWNQVCQGSSTRCSVDRCESRFE
ncbi:hypothetical protein [Actinacidiphila soli]|uniref:hypothetical protein n=1 Tax=Actinacidiphila soli TaxID=2487275 RepID=UPI000FC9CC24|nr:hypothetical protein [Actinacidiphila soli]